MIQSAFEGLHSAFCKVVNALKTWNEMHFEMRELPT